MNDITIRRRNKLIPPKLSNNPHNRVDLVATAMKNFESYGFTLSSRLQNHLLSVSEGDFISWYTEVDNIIGRLLNADVIYKPMYPNFPNEVMEMDEAELYFNAIAHYSSNGTWAPPIEASERSPLLENITLKVLDIGTEEDCYSIFRSISSSNTSLSLQDKDDLTTICKLLKNRIEPYVPETIPQKENVAIVSNILRSNTDIGIELTRKFVKTATDLLRVVIANQSGDVSLSSNHRFYPISRSERKFILSILEHLRSPLEDLARYRETWKRLGEKIHPGEFKKLFPKSFNYFSTLRSKEKIRSHESRVNSLLSSDLKQALLELKERPGVFLRRLDSLLRTNHGMETMILDELNTILKHISTPVLLQAKNHFSHRDRDFRVFFPKGSTTKIYGIPNTVAQIPMEVCFRVISSIESELLSRFQRLEPLGKVYLDPNLVHYNLPFSQRSASKSLRTIVRGSRIPIKTDAKTLRLFLYWKEPQNTRTDIDLSAALLDSNFKRIKEVTYYNLRENTLGVVHSGDIVTAPDGASEFIDIDLNKISQSGIRYVVMTLHSYTQNHFKDLPICFAGWMERSNDTGEVYEPTTVKNRIDLSMPATQGIPLIIDLHTMEAIWCDLACTHRTVNFDIIPDLHQINRGGNNLRNTGIKTAMMVKSIIDMKKPNIHSLLSLHARARGEIVMNESEADIIFSVDKETPFQLDILASEFMA